MIRIRNQPKNAIDLVQEKVDDDDSWPVESLSAGHNLNPVVETCAFAYKATNLVRINDEGVKAAAKLIRRKMLLESYSPRTWRTQPLHICPPEPYHPDNPLQRFVLDWLFVISSLNFSFWSEKQGTRERFGVEWRTGWAMEDRKIHSGYWSLVAALNRALDEDIPITDPKFYSSRILCPDSLMVHIFRSADESTESMPLLKERIAIMRENGSILCNSHGGSFSGFLQDFYRRHDNQGSALDLVKMVTQVFPSFRDQVHFEGRQVYIWKRAQILVAEIWAAFYPRSPNNSNTIHQPHPIFSGNQGPKIHQLTMFADYRVPQILHHLNILTYPTSLLEILEAGVHLPYGCREELSLRAASVVAVDRLLHEILELIEEEEEEEGPVEVQKGAGSGSERRALAESSGMVCSVLIDFYLWDLAKKIETGEEKMEGLGDVEVVPVHRTRSIWY